MFVPSFYELSYSLPSPYTKILDKLGQELLGQLYKYEFAKYLGKIYLVCFIFLLTFSL